MIHIDWSKVQESGSFDRPVPGGYVAMICGVNDREEKECLDIFWDFTDTPYAGANKDTYKRAGFWPTKLYRSYKQSALGMFKAFFIAVEESNPGYRFDDHEVKGLEGKLIGLVLGEEEYQKQNGDIGKRLYVAAIKTIQQIKDGDYKVPEMKTLNAGGSEGRKIAAQYSAFAARPGNFAEVTEDDGDLPF